MNLVKPATWKDGRGVTHLAHWSDGGVASQYGWRLRCSGRLIYPHVGERDVEHEVPTCVRCVYEEFA